MNELKEKELIETNAILQESLTKENEKYYGNLLIYIRIMAFFRDVKKSEELLLEVLTDSDVLSKLKVSSAGYLQSS